MLRSVTNHNPIPPNLQRFRGVPPLTRERSVFDAHPEAFGSFRMLECFGKACFRLDLPHHAGRTRRYR